MNAQEVFDPKGPLVNFFQPNTQTAPEQNETIFVDAERRDLKLGDRLIIRLDPADAAIISPTQTYVTFTGSASSAVTLKPGNPYERLGVEKLDLATLYPRQFPAAPTVPKSFRTVRVSTKPGSLMDPKLEDAPTIFAYNDPATATTLITNFTKDATPLAGTTTADALFQGNNANILPMVTNVESNMCTRGVQLQNFFPSPWRGYGAYEDTVKLSSGANHIIKETTRTGPYWDIIEQRTNDDDSHAFMSDFDGRRASVDHHGFQRMYPRQSERSLKDPLNPMRYYDRDVAIYSPRDSAFVGTLSKVAATTAALTGKEYIFGIHGVTPAEPDEGGQPMKDLCVFRQACKDYRKCATNDFLTDAMWAKKGAELMTPPAGPVTVSTSTYNNVTTQWLAHPDGRMLITINGVAALAPDNDSFCPIWRGQYLCYAVNITDNTNVINGADGKGSVYLGISTCLSGLPILKTKSPLSNFEGVRSDDDRFGLSRIKHGAYSFTGTILDHKQSNHIDEHCLVSIFDLHQLYGVPDTTDTFNNIYPLRTTAFDMYRLGHLLLSTYAASDVWVTSPVTVDGLITQVAGDEFNLNYNSLNYRLRVYMDDNGDLKIMEITGELDCPVTITYDVDGTPSNIEIDFSLVIAGVTNLNRNIEAAEKTWYEAQRIGDDGIVLFVADIGGDYGNDTTPQLHAHTCFWGTNDFTWIGDPTTEAAAYHEADLTTLGSHLKDGLTLNAAPSTISYLMTTPEGISASWSHNSANAKNVSLIGPNIQLIFVPITGCAYNHTQKVIARLPFHEFRQAHWLQPAQFNGYIIDILLRNQENFFIPTMEAYFNDQNSGYTSKRYSIVANECVPYATWTASAAFTDISLTTRRITMTPELQASLALQMSSPSGLTFDTLSEEVQYFQIPVGTLRPNIQSTNFLTNRAMGMMYIIVSPHGRYSLLREPVQKHDQDTKFLKCNIVNGVIDYHARAHNEWNPERPVDLTPMIYRNKGQALTCTQHQMIFETVMSAIGQEVVNFDDPTLIPICLEMSIGSSSVHMMDENVSEVLSLSQTETQARDIYAVCIGVKTISVQSGNNVHVLW